MSNRPFLGGSLLYSMHEKWNVNIENMVFEAESKRKTAESRALELEDRIYCVVCAENERSVKISPQNEVDNVYF